MQSDINSLNTFYIPHLNACWSQYKNIKETKDKIVFFIGTLFITVMFGTGFLIYKYYSSNNDNEFQTTINTLYVVQYFLMHSFFLLLYLYYTYNNIQEKAFLIEAQCCQSKIATTFKEYNKAVPIPFTLLKRSYSDGTKTATFIKGKTVKIAGNIIMVFIYCVFSGIPLLFKKDFILYTENETELKFKFSWIITGLVGFFLLFVIRLTGTLLIKNIKKEILKNWGIEKNNTHNI